MSAKLKDIAQRLNLSVSTVSMILNDKGIRIPEETIGLVKRTAKEMDYQPNRLAKSLVTRKSMCIGLIVPDIQNLFFAELAKHVGNYLKKAGYNLLLCNTDYDKNEDIRQIQMLRANTVDGIIGIFTNSDDYEYQCEIDKLISSKIPLVMMDRIVSNLSTPYVGTDNLYGGYIATKHLIQNGHKGIAFISGPPATVSGQNRYEGYCRALEEAKLPLYEQYVFSGDYQHKSGYEAGKKILSMPEITAVFAGNDMMAYGVYQAVREAGKTVGKDLSVVGFDDLQFSAMLDVPLTSVKQNIVEIAQRAADILLAAVNGDRKAPEKGLTAPTLSVRNSVAKR